MGWKVLEGIKNYNSSFYFFVEIVIVIVIKNFGVLKFF